MSEAVKKKQTYFKRIFFFSIPLMLAGILQCLYNAADLIVVGRFNGEIALAAVGSTGSLTSLILGMFMGLSVGAGVCVAHGVGANNKKEVRETLHTAIIVAFILGVAVGVIGFILAPRLLVLMGTPADVLDSASLYVKIIFLGSPASILYNYCASMLRASGDSKHPLIFLIISGAANVVLNLIFVAIFGIGVAGVALATVISQMLSVVLIIRHFRHSTGIMHFSYKFLKIKKDKLKKILVIGIPSGIQSSLFALANVTIQSSVNSFGSTVMAGNSAAANIDGFYYQAYHAFYDTSLTFVGQSVGAKKFRSIKRILLACIVNILLMGSVITVIGLIFKEALIGLYISDNPDAVAAASVRLVIMISTYFLCGIMEVGSGALRGMGRSVSSAVISLICACLLRVVWLATVFKVFRYPEMIYVTYPISWLLTLVTLFIFLAIFLKKEIKRHGL